MKKWLIQDQSYVTAELRLKPPCLVLYPGIITLHCQLSSIPNGTWTRALLFQNNSLSLQKKSLISFLPIPLFLLSIENRKTFMLWIWGITQSWLKLYMESYSVGKKQVSLKPMKRSRPSNHKGLFIFHGIRKDEQISTSSVLQKKVWAEFDILW